ncbi:hypothetical protein [Pseudoduganella umbonata]|uniref:Uncharacterized protein n=1 Tax=Pseudoduganella umbonata TaxID=864828 RepID=A0A4P8HTQ9_9BURK|nr:hypothetical protein [Pseudoduganella umbonata]MBB3220607.1 hypothetical protein [Pseudoduganella umbonata]QCP11894.1 hypothetical protein FCL38_16825 [Pseudoduganella umbonata]
MKSLLFAALLSLACANGQAADASSPSQAVGEASGLVVAGSLATVLVAGSVVAVGLAKAGEGVDLLLQSAVDGSRATVRLSGKAAEGLSVAAGTAVDVSATATGHLLVVSGKAIAFIPNEMGKALLHSRKVS